MALAHSIAYGIDFSADRLLVARATRRAPASVILDTPTTSPEAREWLAAAARESARAGSALAVSAPAAQTILRCLQTPFTAPRKAAGVWATLLDVDLPFPVEAAACAYTPPRREASGTAVTAAVIRAIDLDAFEETCRESGCEPTHCDAEALALWSQIAHEAPPARAETPRAVVWLAPDHVTLARGRGTDFMAAHVLRLSYNAADRASFEALWAARGRQILSAHLTETGAAEMDIWWAGPGAKDSALVARLQQALGGDLRLRHATPAQPESLLARALAQRALDGSGLNFKTGKRIHPGLLRRAQRKVRRASQALLAVALLVLGLNAGIISHRRAQDRDQQRALYAAAAAIAGPHIPPGQERLLVERALARRDEDMRPFRNAADPFGLEIQWVEILNAAADMDVEISRLELTDLALTIEGASANIQAGEALADKLRAQGWNVQVDSPGRTPEGRQQFIVKGPAIYAR
ncbi:MAG: hypothetical protein ACOX3F_06800 [Kiritimatiellia bacterium]|jgi:hypothetical protein